MSIEYRFIIYFIIIDKLLIQDIEKKGNFTWKYSYFI